MRFKTKITEMLGIQYPIIGGTMMSITDADFAASISNAGGLGVLASAIYKSNETFEAAIDRLLSLTSKPVAVNINLFPGLMPADNDAYSEIMIKKGIRIVETSGHSAPEHLYKKWKDAGLIWMHKCVGVRYAMKVEKMGADIITVVGYENGGATGKLDVATLPLVPAVVDAVKVPVIGGGGVSDGRGFLALLSLGAAGVIMGTRLLLTKEAPIHDNLKNALLKATETDTILAMRSIGATHRVWDNACARRILDLEAKQAGLDEIFAAAAGEKARKMYQEGLIDIGMISCGQGIGVCRDIPTVKTLFDRIISEASQIHGHISPA